MAQNTAPAQKVNAATGTVERLQKVADLLKEWGFNVTLRSGWNSNQARKDIKFAPVGILDHSTAGNGTSLRMLFDDGNGVVPGPLCQFAVLRQDSEIVLGAAGYANHSGYGSKASGEQIISGKAPLDKQITPGPTQNYSVNRSTIGIEVQAAGNWTEGQYKATIALNAALVLAFGWSKTAPPLGGHKEFTRRRNDPYENMAKIRKDTIAFIKEKESAPKPPVEPTDPKPPAEKPTLPKRPGGKRPLLKETSPRMKGAWVKYFQECAILLYPKESKPMIAAGGADGVYGPASAQTAKNIQKAFGFTAKEQDGKVGEQTWGKFRDLHGVG